MLLGKKDIEISRLGLGTWAIGGGPAWSGEVATNQAVEVIQEAPRLGINLIDTAPGYNFGNSEKIIGTALKKMDRSSVKIITKCGITWTRTGSLFNIVGNTQLYKNLSPDSIKEELEASLDRLGVEYIDVYMTHWQSVEPYFTPISETMEYLCSLKEQGLIKAIGAANITIEQVEEYLKYGELDIVQGKYSILDRSNEYNLIPLCKELDITFQAYSPLEQGLLSGTISRDYVPPDGSAQKNKKWFQPNNLIKAIDMLEMWKPLCEKYNCTLPSLAIAWLLKQGNHINVLTGAVSIDQLKENMKALDVNLSTEDSEYLRSLAEDVDS